MRIPQSIFSRAMKRTIGFVTSLKRRKQRIRPAPEFIRHRPPRQVSMACAAASGIDKTRDTGCFGLSFNICVKNLF